LLLVAPPYEPIAPKEGIPEIEIPVENPPVDFLEQQFASVSFEPKVYPGGLHVLQKALVSIIGVFIKFVVTL
jgi:hypothetical protein